MFVSDNNGFDRRSKHTHNPVDDARGNAEALLHMRDAMQLKIDLR